MAADDEGLYCCSKEGPDHFQHCILCTCVFGLWCPCWLVACCVPGFCPVPFGDNFTCESKQYIDPGKRLLWKLGKVNTVHTVEIAKRPQIIAGIICPSPQILRAPVSGIPCVIYHVVAWEYVRADAVGAVDFDDLSEEQLKDGTFDINGSRDDYQNNENELWVRRKWVKRFEEMQSADFYLSDPNFPPLETNPESPVLFCPASAPGATTNVGKIRALDFDSIRRDRGKRGVLSVTFSGREAVPPNIVSLAKRHGMEHSRSWRRVMRYEERTFCVGDPVALMGNVASGWDRYGKPMPVMQSLQTETLPDEYFGLLTLTRAEKVALRGASGNMLAAANLEGVEPPFVGCVCYNEVEPCGGCTPQGCSKLC